MKKDVYLVAGNPVFHSKSPDIYNYLFKKYGIDAVYLPVQLDSDDFRLFADNFIGSLNVKGMNVTMPLKEVAAGWISQLDDVSTLLKSVNTIDFRNNKGYTTDGKGIVLSLSYQGVDVKDKSVVVLGAGGAARSVCYELLKSGAHVTILNRTVEKARYLCQMLQMSCEYGALADIADYMDGCDLLINCTNMGMRGRDFETVSFLTQLKKTAFVYDIVYEPPETLLLNEAKRLGHKTSNGLDMLVCQALYAFEIYTDKKPCKQDRDELLNIIGLV